ncbi:MAG: SWIM zinc finger family protein, partial [Bacteroidota bacterium]|nr:SWIM zinc finger family protein [Bacteroidota bacterium]
MALPHLIKYIYSAGTDEVIRRGKKIHSAGFVELVDHDEMIHSVSFRVKDDSYSTFYKVSVQKYEDPKLFMIRCTCPYNLGDICRHEAAALFQLQDLIDRNLLFTHDAIRYDQRHTVVKMKAIDLKTIRMMAGQENFEQAEDILRTHKLNIVKAADEKVEATLEMGPARYRVLIQKNEERNFDTSCTCEESQHPLCAHKVALLLQLLNSHGPQYFDSIRNWDKEKNKLLELYGYSLEENLDGKFEFIYKEGKPFLKVLDPSIKKIGASAPPAPKPFIVAPKTEPEEKEVLLDTREFRVAMVINANEGNFPHFSFDLVRGTFDEEKATFVGRLEKLDLGKFINMDSLEEEDRHLIQQVRKLQQAEINKYLNRNSPFSGFWENIIHYENEELPEETRVLILEFLHPKVRKLLQEQRVILYLPKGKKFQTASLQSIDSPGKFPSLHFYVSPQEDRYRFTCRVRLENEELDPDQNQIDSALLVLYNGEIYTWENMEDALIAQKFSRPLVVPQAEWPSFLQEMVLPLTRQYRVTFDQSLVSAKTVGDPETSVLLEEKGDYLLFRPVFNYKGYEVKPEDRDTIY